MKLLNRCTQRIYNSLINTVGSGMGGGVGGGQVKHGRSGYRKHKIVFLVCGGGGGGLNRVLHRIVVDTCTYHLFCLNP